MRVTGEDASRYDAVRRDDMKNVNHGTLTLADEATGEVQYVDRITTQTVTVSLGPHAIAIVVSHPRGRS